jgi:hypothetical protein
MPKLSILNLEIWTVLLILEQNINYLNLNQAARTPR